MDNKEFEKKLEQIKTFKEVTVSVDKKIQKAFEKIEENEKLEKQVKKQKSKFNFGRVLSLAASFVMAVFLVGNGVAYAKGEPNIYSWVLEKIGIQKEYEEIKTEINQTVESEEIKITLLDIGYDKNCIIAGLKLNITEKNSKYENLIDQIHSISESVEITINGEKINIETADVYRTIYSTADKGKEYPFYTTNIDIIKEKISNTECIIYTLLDVSAIDLNFSSMNIKLNVHDIEIQYIEDGQILYSSIGGGEWYFEEIKDIKATTYKNYLIRNNQKNDERYQIDLIEVNNSDLSSMVYCSLKYSDRIYEKDFLQGFTWKLYDLKGVMLGEANCENNVMMKNKLEENQKYYISVYEYDLVDNENGSALIKANEKLLYTLEFVLNNSNKVNESYMIDINEAINLVQMRTNEDLDDYIRIRSTENISVLEGNKLRSISEDYGIIVRILDEDKNKISEIELDNSFSGLIHEKVITEVLIKNKKYNLEVYKYEYDEEDRTGVYKNGPYLLYSYDSEEELDLIYSTEFELK